MSISQSYETCIIYELDMPQNEASNNGQIDRASVTKCRISAASMSGTRLPRIWNVFRPSINR